jgi:manganese oxidase
MSPDPTSVSRRGLVKAVGTGAAWTAAVVGFFGMAAATRKEEAEAAVNSLGGTEGLDSELDPTNVDHPALAEQLGGRSLVLPAPPATENPYPNLNELLYPKPAEPAQQGRVRELTLQTDEKTIEICKGVKFAAWTYNGTIPGPVIRATQGDTLRIKLKNNGMHPHSIHFHGMHPANQDGVFQAAAPGGEQIYEFTAKPFGVFPYHCHSEPIDQHITRGLFGAMIIDPPTPRPPAKEMVMVMNGYDLNFDQDNDLYSINGLPAYYEANPIELKVGELVRIYLVNMTEYDAVNSLHLHANMFDYYPAGTSLTPLYKTDVVHLGVADRGILEFRYESPGMYMFHAHQVEFSMQGWKAMFHVTEGA